MKVSELSDCRSLETLIKGVRVTTRLIQDNKIGNEFAREHTVFGFSHLPKDLVENGTVSDFTIFVKDEREHDQVSTVAAYFKRKY